MEYWISLKQSEFDAINLAISAFLKIPIETVKLEKVESEMYEKMKEEMKYIQMRFDDLKKLRNDNITGEEH